MSSPLRVLIADDHLVVREGLRLILETADRFELVGQASDGEEAVQLAEELKPDVILMDLRMPGMSGIDAIKRIRERQPASEIVILTTYDEDDLMVEGLRAGARGFLLKDVSRETLFHTMQVAARGETVLGADTMRRLLDASGATHGRPARTAFHLTARELQILHAIVRGERNKDIAVQLGITERTVKAHLSSTYSKLGVQSRAAAVATAMRRGLVSTRDPVSS